MKRALLCALLLTSSAAFAQAKVDPNPTRTPEQILAGTITAGATSWALNSTTWTATSSGPTNDFTIGGQDQLFRDWWFYRLGSDTREFTFPTPTTETYVGNTATLTWTNLNGTGLNATLTVVVADAPARTTQTMVIGNPTAGAIDFNMFRYVDFDLVNTAGADSAVLFASPTTIDVVDGTRGMRIVATGAANYAVTAFSTLQGLLTNTVVDNFANTGLPFGPGDFTGGFQWASVSIPAGGNQQYVSTYETGTSFTLTTNSPQSVNAVVGQTTPVPITANIANPSGGTYTVTVSPDISAPPIAGSNVSTYIGFPPTFPFVFSRDCTPTVRGQFSLVHFVTATQTGGVVVGTNPQTVNNVTWACQTPSDLTLAISDGGVTATAGTPVTYAFNYAQVSPQFTEGVVISTTVPVGTTFNAAGSTAGWSCADGSAAGTACTFNVGNVGAAPAGGTANFAVNVLPSTTAALSISGSIADDGVGGADLTPANNAANDTTPVVVEADLAMALTDSPDPVVAGTQLTYTATLTNGGPSDATNVQFALPLAAGTSFVSATPSAGGTCTNTSPVTCTWAGVTAPAGVRSATIVVLVAANVLQGTNLSATATASSATTDPNAANNAATATTAVIAQADIAMTAFTDSPDPVVAGTNLTYQVAMINNGPSDAQNARFSLPLPTGTSFVSAAPSAGGSCTNTSPVTCTWAGATAPATSRSATIVVLVAPSVLQGTTLNAVVTGTSDTTDPVAGNNSLATSTLVNAVADLQIGLTASVPQSELGQTVTFTATSTNGGPSDAQNVVLSITLSPDFRYGSHTASAGAVCTTPQIGNSGVISCTWAGATAPGVVRTLAVDAASFSPGTSSIQAATSSDTTDPVPTSNNVASVSVLVGNPVEPIPTLSQWSLLLLGLLVGLIGVAMVRRD